MNMNFVNTSLFVGDLPKFCAESDLEQFFSPFGPVLDVKIKRNVNTGKTLSYGFVTLSTEALAGEAIRATDGAMFLGRKLRVRWAMYNAKTQNPVNQSVINSVYVRFVSPKIDQYVTEEDLHGVFDPFGGVLDVSIKESSVDIRSNRQSGYGFVHFSCDNLGIEAAFQAVAALDNATIDGVTYNVELSKNLLKQFNSESGSQGTPRKEESQASPAISPTGHKSITSPSRSMNNLYQTTSTPGNIFNPHTPHRPQIHDVDRVCSVDLSPQFNNLVPEQIVRTPLRNCSSMNAIKYSPAQHQLISRSPHHADHAVSRSLSHRIDRNYVASSSQATGSTVFTPNTPGGFGGNIINGSSGVIGSPASIIHHKLPSRENSFRSVGARSCSGSFRTLNARSSSANSMSSSYGTTVSCASSPSPFHTVTVDGNGFDKVQSFRSDPGVARISAVKSNRMGQVDQYGNLLAQSSHSLSFQDSPLSRSLFSVHPSDYLGSDVSLLNVPGQNLLKKDFRSSSFHNQFDGELPRRPDSRASDCSDVSTDSETAVLILSAKESNLDFLSPNSNQNDDFFAFLNTGNNSSGNKLMESTKDVSLSQNSTTERFEPTQVLNVDSIHLNSLPASSGGERLFPSSTLSGALF